MHPALRTATVGQDEPFGVDHSMQAAHRPLSTASTPSGIPKTFATDFTKDANDLFDYLISRSANSCLHKAMKSSG